MGGFAEGVGLVELVVDDVTAGEGDCHLPAFGEALHDLTLKFHCLGCLVGFYVSEAGWEDLYQAVVLQPTHMQAHCHLLYSSVLSLGVAIGCGGQHNGLRGETHYDHLVEFVFLRGFQTPNI